MGEATLEEIHDEEGKYWFPVSGAGSILEKLGTSHVASRLSENGMVLMRKLWTILAMPQTVFVSADGTKRKTVPPLSAKEIKWIETQSEKNETAYACQCKKNPFARFWGDHCR